MKRIMIVLFVCVGLIAGCNSNNNRGYSSYNGKHKKKKGSYANSSYKPGKNKRMSSAENTGIDTVNIAESNQASALDSLLPGSESNVNSTPKVNYQGSTGMGMGGSYASSSYRHDEMNKKKYEKKALAKQREREALMKQRARASQAIRTSDSLNTQVQMSDSTVTTEADSSQYLKNSY